MKKDPLATLVSGLFILYRNNFRYNCDYERKM